MAVISFLFFYIIILNEQGQGLLLRKQSRYEKYFQYPPRRAQYPFGDEYFNRDMKTDHTQEEFEPIDREETGIFIECPAYTNIERKHDYGSMFTVICEKCDVNYRSKYIISCSKCRPINNVAAKLKPAKCVSSQYLEIANYTDSN